jgi:hypothetical protein
MNIFKNMKIEDMPTEDLRWMAEDFGIDVIAQLFLHFGKGITIYIPKFEPKNWQAIKIDDLPSDDMKLVAEKCGISIVKKLTMGFPQYRFYIPRIETTEWAKKYIRNTYNGSNAKRIASDLGVSERFVYKSILKIQAKAAIKVKDGYEYIDGCRQEKIAF